MRTSTIETDSNNELTGMTPNKQFNTYKEGLDLEFLWAYCLEHGERRVMERGETPEETGGLSGIGQALRNTLRQA